MPAAALTVREKKPLESLRVLPAAITAVENELGAGGRVLVRYSGTEPRLRLLVEDPTRPAVESGMGKLLAAARAHPAIFLDAYAIIYDPPTSRELRFHLWDWQWELLSHFLKLNASSS